MSRHSNKLLALLYAVLLSLIVIIPIGMPMFLHWMDLGDKPECLGNMASIAKGSRGTPSFCDSQKLRRCAPRARSHSVFRGALGACRFGVGTVDEFTRWLSELLSTKDKEAALSLRAAPLFKSNGKGLELVQQMNAALPGILWPPP